MKIEPTRAATKAPTRGRLPGPLHRRRGPDQHRRDRRRQRPRPRRHQPDPHGRLGNLEKSGWRFSLKASRPSRGLLAAVEEQVGVVGQLLDPGVAVLVGVEAGLDQAQGEGGEGEHVAAPGDGLALELVERHDRVDQAHLQRLLGVVLAAEQPELLRLLGPDQVAQQRGAEAAVPGADPRPGLAEDGVVGGDRQVAADVEDVAAADRVAGDHRHHRLRQPPHLHLQVGDVEAAERGALGDVAGVAADRLVAAGAERLRPLAGEDDHADLGVLAGQLQRGARPRPASAAGRR